MSYSELIEEIQALPTEEKIEVRSLIDKYLIEERREEIFQNHLDALKMAKNGELNFTSDTDELMKRLG
jgi:hypothetical protein